MRKMIAFYLKGVEGASKLKVRLFACKNCLEIEEILSEITFL
jgi:tRNA-dihydrouridine synthase